MIVTQKRSLPNAPGVVAFFVLALTIQACGRPECKNRNPVFDQNNYESATYKNELGKQMDRVGANNLRYWYEKSVKRNNKSYLVVYIQGEGLCAMGELQVTDSTKSKGLANQTGRSGAELRGVSVIMEQDGKSTNLMLNGIEEIGN